MTREAIVHAIHQERTRQGAKWEYRHAWGWGDCSSQQVPSIVKAAVLSEEAGEVCKAVLEQDDKALTRELIQVAAVAVAWLESL